MRLWARKNGFSLSEKALVPRMTEDLTGAPIAVHTEKDVFDALGLEYKAPEERDI
jgi:DNA polymerase beta